jgi:hypothetical protein
MVFADAQHPVVRCRELAEDSFLNTDLLFAETIRGVPRLVHNL